MSVRRSRAEAPLRVIERLCAKLLVSAALLLFAQHQAAACTCVPATLESRFEGAASVFTAVVVTQEPAGERGRLRSASFQITETFKSEPQFDRFVSQSMDSLCGINLEIGTEYLFFAPESGEIGQCSGVRRTADAEAELAALRAFVSGEHGDLAQPWRFTSSDDGCIMTTLFDIGEDHPPGFLVISTSKLRAAEGGDAAEFAFAELEVHLRFAHEASDRKRAPLELAVNGHSYEAAWTPGRTVEVPDPDGNRFRLTLPDSYVLLGDDVERLLDKLVNTDALKIRYDGHRDASKLEWKVRTTNLAEAGAEMLKCLRVERA